MSFRVLCQVIALLLSSSMVVQASLRALFGSELSESGVSRDQNESDSLDGDSHFVRCATAFRKDD